jgi:hypothetical protein
MLLWFAFGGARAIGPDDQLMGEAGASVERHGHRDTSFSTAQVGIHGVLGLLTAFLVTYGAHLDADRTDGYIALLVALVVTSVPGAVMFAKWVRGTRAHVPGLAVDDRRRVEDRLPRSVVIVHGLAAVATVAVVAVLLVVD